MTIGDNIRYSQAKPIIQLDKNYNLIGVYESSRIAQEKTGCDQSSIIKCIKGKAKTCGGYKWLLYEDYFKLTTDIDMNDAEKIIKDDIVLAHRIYAREI